MNKIDFYTDGTFEGAEGGWTYNNPSFIQALSYSRSNDFAFEGLYSGKFETRSESTGFQYLMNVIFPANSGENIEASFRIRCTAGIPNGVDFILLCLPASGRQAYILKANAVQSKLGWVEIKTNLIPSTYYDPTLTTRVASVSLMAISNWNKFIASFSPGYVEANFPQYAEYAGTNDTSVPAGEFVYVDALFADLAAPVEVPDIQLVGRKLYHIENVFLLSVGGVVLEIDEPIGWDKILLNVNFDLSSFRYKFEFTDKDVTLEFDRPCGYVQLQAEWDVFGPNAEASLKFGERDLDTNVLTIHTEMSLNFAEDYADDEFTVKMNAEKKSLQDTFRTRFDMDVDLFDDQTIDGRPVAPLIPKMIWLHPTQILHRATFIGNPNAEKTNPIPFDPNTGNLARSVPPLKQVINDIEGIQEPTVPTGTIYYSGSSFKPGLSFKRLSISITVKMNITFPFSGTGIGTNVGWGLRLLRVSNISGPAGDPFLAPYQGPNNFLDQRPNNPGYNEALLNVVANLDLLPDEGLFVYVYALANGGSMVITEANFMDPELWQMSINETAIYAGTLVTGYSIFDTLTRQIELITGVANALKSDFFGGVEHGYLVNGCGHNNMLLNGLMIREIQKEFILSAKDWFNALSTLWCLGMSIERNNANQEWIRLEPLERFFRDVEVMRLTIIQNTYNREVASEFLFNELEFGYSKSPSSNQPGSLNDPFTKKNYVTPWKSLKAKLSKLCDFIVSPLYIELTRQENVRNNPSGNYETDRNTFMINYRTEVTAINEATGIQFVAADSKIIINRWDIPVAEGEKITIGSTTSNNGIKTVVTVSVNIRLNKVELIVQEAVVNEVGATTNITFASPRLVPARDEEFDIINNLDQVGTGSNNKFPYYNLRHHVKRMSLRWSKFYATAFTEGFIVRFISGVNKNNLETALKPTASCIGMDGRSAAHVVGDSTIFDKQSDVDSNSRNMSKALFGKNKINFDAPLSWPAFNRFRMAFEGRHPAGKDYGYITIMNPKNEEEKVYALSGKYNPITQMIKFETIEKAK